jgi:hypothetical protein
VLGALRIFASLAALAIGLLMGVRLLVLARRTRELPELAIGLAFLLQGAVTAAAFLTLRLAGEALGPLAPPLAGVGWLSMNAGALGLAFFTWRVFRRDGVGAALFAGCVAAGACGLVGVALTDRDLFLMRTEVRSGGFWWVGFASRFVTYGWMTSESLSYYAKMRRRLRLGLCEPIAANRFLLWASASGAIFLNYVLLAGQALRWIELAPESASLIQVSLTLAAAVANWLVFFPPRFYIRAVAAPSR